MPFIFAIVVLAALAWWVLSRRYADKLGNGLADEYKSICVTEEKDNGIQRK
jgi:hypothetical protein